MARKELKSHKYDEKKWSLEEKKSESFNDGENRVC